MLSINKVGQYYSARAEEYDVTASYLLPKHAVAIAPIKARYQLALQGHDVLEIACGPGYWTEAVALTARTVLATDLDPALVSKVKRRLLGVGNVQCQVADAYTLDGVSGPFTAAFSQFWWSHVPMSKLRLFLNTLHSKLKPGALVMFLDDLPYDHSGGRRVDEAGDLLEERVLRNGDKFEIIKNFPSESDINDTLAGSSEQVSYKQFRAFGYWTLSYRTR